MAIKAVLFDLDGTLIDSSEGIIHSVTYALEKMGLSADIRGEKMSIEQFAALSDTLCEEG